MKTTRGSEHILSGVTLRTPLAWSFRMYCCLTLQTVINHKLAGHLSQWAARPSIALGLPPRSSFLWPPRWFHSRKKGFCCEFVTAQTSTLLWLCLWVLPVERGSTNTDAELHGKERTASLQRFPLSRCVLSHYDQFRRRSIQSFQPL